jgi:hypothetical protein
VGVLRQEQEADIYTKWHISGTPRVVLKFATSLDKHGSEVFL